MAIKALSPKSRLALAIVAHAKRPLKIPEVNKRASKLVGGKRVELSLQLMQLVPRYLERSGVGDSLGFKATDLGHEIIANCDAAVRSAQLSGGSR